MQKHKPTNSNNRKAKLQAALKKCQNSTGSAEADNKAILDLIKEADEEEAKIAAGIDIDIETEQTNTQTMAKNRKPTSLWEILTNSEITVIIKLLLLKICQFALMFLLAFSAFIALFYGFKKLIPFIKELIKSSLNS